VKAKKISKQDLIEKYYSVVPIHKCNTDPHLVDETIRLINSFWEKSRSERLSTLNSSKDNLPMSLIVIFKKKERDLSKDSLILNDLFFDRQDIDAPTICSETGRSINVLAHLRLVRVPADSKACFIESMIVRNEFRGKGLGSFFIKQTEKFCEETLHLKRIYLSTYDSGEFYMKIGFSLIPAICVYGNGEVNTVSKKIYLKKDLNYVEKVEQEEEEPKDVYDPLKDYNYVQQKQIENDLILRNFPFKIDKPKSYVERLCSLLEYNFDDIKYFYSFQTVSKESGRRNFFLMLSTVSVDKKMIFFEKLNAFGVLYFQNFFDNSINDCDNRIIKHSERYTNLNYVIKNELKQLLKDRWITDYKFENHQFYALQNENWIVVKNLQTVDYLKTPELPDLPDEEVVLWDNDEEEKDTISENLEKLRHHFKTTATDESWWKTLRRPSEIKLEPLQRNETDKSSENRISDEYHENSWVNKINNCNEALTFGLMIDEF
jgi:predicted GNAT family N-acyltransferase